MLHLRVERPSDRRESVHMRPKSRVRAVHNSKLDKSYLQLKSCAQRAGKKCFTFWLSNKIWNNCQFKKTAANSREIALCSQTANRTRKKIEESLTQLHLFVLKRTPPQTDWGRWQPDPPQTHKPVKSHAENIWGLNCPGYSRNIVLLCYSRNIVLWCYSTYL